MRSKLYLLPIAILAAITSVTGVLNADSVKMQASAVEEILARAEALRNIGYDRHSAGGRLVQAIFPGEKGVLLSQQLGQFNIDNPQNQLIRETLILETAKHKVKDDMRLVAAAKDRFLSEIGEMAMSPVATEGVRAEFVALDRAERELRAAERRLSGELADNAREVKRLVEWDKEQKAGHIAERKDAREKFEAYAKELGEKQRAERDAIEAKKIEASKPGRFRRSVRFAGASIKPALATAAIAAMVGGVALMADSENRENVIFSLLETLPSDQQQFLVDLMEMMDSDHQALKQRLEDEIASRRI